MRERIIYILLYCFCHALTGGFTQNMPELPKLEPSYINNFHQEDVSYSNKCFDRIYFDRRGRLWLSPCGNERLINSIGLFQFDGYQFQPTEVFTPKGEVMESPLIWAIDREGRLLGVTEEKQLFLMDPDTQQSMLVTPADTALAGLVVRGISAKNDKTYVLGSWGEDQMALFRLEKDVLVVEHPFKLPSGQWQSGDFFITVNPREVWLVAGSLPVYRFDRKERTLHAYYAPGFKAHTFTPRERKTDHYLEKIPRLSVSPHGDAYLYLSADFGYRLFQFDREGNQFLHMAEAFPTGWRPRGLFPDEAGNICFLFQDGTDVYRAVLETSDGQRFDYSSVLAGSSGIRHMAGRDLRRQVFILTEEGIRCVGIRDKKIIRQALKDQWISSMASLPDGRLLVNTVDKGWFVYDETTGETAVFQGPDCATERPAFGWGMKQQIIPDTAGNLWFASYNHLIRYRPAANECQAFDLGRQTSLFDFVGDDLIILQHRRADISFFDLRTQKPVSPGPWLPDHLNSFIRDILVDSRGLLWIPTNNGLWKIDLAQEQSEVLGLEQGFADSRFTSIYEDDRGRLWLGTYFGGLHIYDPDSGDMTVIDQRQGLSNNVIMSIVADDEGDMWVATEYGINIVSKEGEVLNSIYEEDGLAHETFERFDPFKARDGRLFFGSRRGVSLIDPAALKAYIKSDTSVQIYLTELSFFNKKENRDVVLNRNLQQLGRIDIPAERPYIRLQFALSSYLEPYKNRYAYRLEGIDEDWHYLGAQPELNISRLPPGKYRLLIKGADFRNNWTQEPIAIDIHAREFFYKQGWFYFLLALPFLAFGLLWARNKQLEARRLEKEVALRTQKIREDKAVIEQQAAELRQLDTMKSRFFTNISHELRTPITLIRAPLENLIQKHGASIDERMRRSLKLVLNNAGKLGRLVEELLELSSLEAKKATLKETPTPLRPFCRQLFSAYESGAALKNIDYRFDADLDEEALFLVDRTRLEKIINNLLSNALKFTPAGGTVQMRLLRAEAQLQVEVEDNGRGIPPEDLPYLFDRYFQTRRDDIATEGGTGIGLALSRELALLIQGDLSVRNEWEKGACFTLRFPAKEAPPEEEPVILPEISPPAISPEEQPGAAPLIMPAENDGPRTKILIVEDNPDMQQLIQTLLADHYDCTLANNGAEAWTWLKEEDQRIADIELILSDVMMPEMDGYTLLEKIKEHQRWQRFPVVMLTARSAEEDKLQALRMGVDDYLLKPFSPEELRARLQNLISNYQVRKQLSAEVEQQVEGVNITFEPAESADMIWLREVETAAREALDKEIKLTTAFLADKVFLSERQFARKLKAATGLTPNEYIQEVKLQKARHLLEHRVYTTINEVAQAAGYSSGSYLTKLYQERFGKKPGDYF